MEWQPIESAPKDQIVDLWLDDGHGGFRLADCTWTGAYWFSGNWKYDCGAEILENDPRPTHWMPRPEPPSS